MRTTHLVTFVSLTALLAVVGLGFVAMPAPLAAAGSGQFTAVLDTDLDGLDDALEARFGTDPTLADTDGDGFSDLEEKFLGIDPLKADIGTMPGQMPPGLELEIYAVGDQLIMQVFGLFQNRVDSLQFYFAGTTIKTQVLSFRDMAPFFVGVESVNHSFPGRNLRVARFAIPRSHFDLQGSSALAVSAVADGQSSLGDSCMMITIDNTLSEVRPDVVASSTMNGQSSNSMAGGLFPVDPEEGPGPEGSANEDQVCVQVMQEVANMGGGRVAYRVSDAYCDPLPSAVCFSGCTASVETIVIGIDIVGLLGG